MLPDAAYQAESTEIDISSLVDGVGGVSHVSDASVSIGFGVVVINAGGIEESGSAAFDKETVPTYPPTWSLPPMSESATPPIIDTLGAYDIWLCFTHPVLTFGCEIQPVDDQAPRMFTARFYSGQTIAGTISENISGWSASFLTPSAIPLTSCKPCCNI